ncbi:Glycosyltransferase involved in cell wall bisynthesis [Pseudobutyrivibrio sp. UC1225]|uniref:glycosyltransferase n=1 Tax=Pseudobutyrivibrio sp. UC1225 TaxID=1798185 RepID=UPI0008E80E7B|nr:glycosyltransferase [Pseudobutyrivibrio sp. UC1225]SFN58442.1 Glycosyltransferase involved in cell wall bisynthesis [Pseudobutyrivibrio sp. UC1225]
MKKKILIMNDLAFGGGVEKLMYDLVWAWHEKYDITVMTYKYDDTFYEHYPKDVNYISESVPKEYKSNIFVHILSYINRRYYELTFMGKIRKSKFDVMLCMKEGGTLYSALKYDIPLKYAWNHTDYNNHYYSEYIYGSKENERIAMQQFKNIVCVSQDIKKGVCDVIGDPGNLIVKYNPINIENVLKKAKEPVVDIDSMELPKEKQPIRFVSVGRINAQKGYTLLIEACRALEEEGYNFEVIVVGGREPWGEEYEKIQETLGRTGVTSCKFIGPRQNPYKYISIADWFISSSLYEGYSLVSQEAAVLDVPMLLTDCSGVRELLGDSEYGIVMPIHAIGIYKSMKRVMDDPSLHDYYKNKIMERKKIITYQERISEIEKLIEDNNE